jgi:hypothetical protein
MDDRRTFLIEMYNQMFSDINRHITVIWQSVGVVVGAFAIFSLVEKDIIPNDIATSIIVILCFWLFFHMLDAGYWYNRNLAIISNIEKQFLDVSDLKNVHYYFGLHRSKKNRMITHLKIQAALGWGILFLVILYHFLDRILPGMRAQHSEFDPVRGLPYFFLIAGLSYGAWLWRDRDESYSNFVTNSPGLEIDTSSVSYGKGHTTDTK